MAVLVYRFGCTIPAGTAIATPDTIAMAFPIYPVQKIRWRVPPGPSGQMGFYIANANSQVIPFASGAPNWIVADNEYDDIEFDDYPTSGSWQLVGYNLGNYAHTVYVTFDVTAPSVIAAPVPTLPNSVLSSS